jgi:hypothetical protein
MKKLWLFIIVLSLSFPPIQAKDNQRDSNHSVSVEIPAFDTWSFEIIEDELSLITIQTNVLTPPNTYHIFVQNASFYTIISRYNKTGDISFNFIWKGFYRVSVTNPGSSSLSINVDLSSDLLQEKSDEGYFFVSQDNWSIQQRVSNSSLTIVSVKSLERGNYTLRFSILKGNGLVKFYSSKKNPTNSDNWKDTADSFSWSDSTKRFFILDQGYDWFVFETLDEAEHDVVISLVFNSRLKLKLRDIVIGIALIAAIIALISTRVNIRRIRRPRTNYYEPQQTVKDVQQKLHLVSQVDIRHEGGRYVYIPPDILDSRLLKKDKPKDKKEEE